MPSAPWEAAAPSEQQVALVGELVVRREARVAGPGQGRGAAGSEHHRCEQAERARQRAARRQRVLTQSVEGLQGWSERL